MKIAMKWIFIILLTGLLLSCSTKDRDNIDLRIENKLSKIFKSNTPGMTLIAVKDGKTVLQQAYGLANVELNVPMEIEMLFKLGSISKQFTVAAILMLEEREELSIEDPISKYFDGLDPALNEVTLRHLLTHTSGIKNYNGLDVWKNEIRNPITPKQQMDMFIHESQWFKAGEKWSYSNSGYNLLAQVVAQVSGQSFESFVEENIFKAAGMKNTLYAKDDAVVSGLVKGYRNDEDGLKTAEYMSMSHTYGGGDVISCVGDLAKWHQALISGTLINEMSLKKSLTPAELNDGKRAHYGMGWFIEPYRNMINYYHGGGVYGFVTHSMYIPEENLYIAILKNCVDPYTKLPTHVIGNMIADEVLGYNKEQEADYVEIDLDESIMELYVGTYQFVESPGKRKIELIDGKLHYRRPPREGDVWSKTAILPLSANEFFTPGKKSTILFNKDNTGKVVGIHVKQAFGRVVKLKKISDEV